MSASDDEKPAKRVKIESNDLEKLHDWVKNLRIPSGDSPAPEWPLGVVSESESEFEGFFHPVSLSVHNLTPATAQEDVVGFFSGVAQFVRFENVHGDEDEDKQEPPVSKIALMRLPSLEATRRAVKDLRGRKLNNQIVYLSRCATRLHSFRVTGNFGPDFSSRLYEAFKPYGRVLKVSFPDSKQGLCYVYLVKNDEPFFDIDGEDRMMDCDLKGYTLVEGTEIGIQKCSLKKRYIKEDLDEDEDYDAYENEESDDDDDDESDDESDDDEGENKENVEGENEENVDYEYEGDDDDESDDGGSDEA